MCEELGGRCSPEASRILHQSPRILSENLSTTVLAMSGSLYWGQA